MARTEDVRRLNMQRILDVFLKHGVCTKNTLQQETGLSLGTCTNSIKRLLEEGQIIRIEDGDSTGGRKAKRYALVEDYFQMGLVFLHHHENSDEIKCQIVDLRQHVISKLSKTYPELALEDLKNELLTLKQSYPKLHLFALSVPGIVEDGHISFCDMEQLRDMNLKVILEEALQLTVLIENDVNIATLGYAKSLKQVPDNFALVYQPSDKFTGCGLMIHGKLLLGATHFAGELGYLPIDSRGEQQKSLKTKKGATMLLAKQIASLIAVVNPEMIAIVSKKVTSLDKLKLKITKWIDQNHLAQLVLLDELDPWIIQGLACLCLDQLRYSSEIENYEKEKSNNDKGY